jgi:hypothetical protein
MLDRLQAERPGESICTFVRRCDYRSVDLLALRATFEEVTGYMGSSLKPFPIRPDDRFEADLLIDPEDLEDMAVVIAARAGRSLENTSTNPFYTKVETPFDLVRFLSHQPMSS